MTIILSDHTTPAAALTTTVRFPGDKHTYTVPTSEALTIGQLRRIQSGDIDALFAAFPADVAKRLDDLRPAQFSEFVQAWLKADTDTDAPKD